MRTLPDGSLTVAALHPERSWTREQHLAADIVNSVYAAATALCGGKASEAPRVPRPRDVAAAGAAAERAGIGPRSHREHRVGGGDGWLRSDARTC